MPNLPGLSSTQDDPAGGRRQLRQGTVLDDGARMKMPGLRPAAAPVETFVRPAEAPINNDLKSLAEGLSMLNPALQQYADVENQKAKKDAPDAVAQLTAGKTGAEVQTMIRSGQHPVLNQAANKELVGNVVASRQGDDDAAQLTQWYQTEYDRNSGTLSKQIDEYVSKRVTQLGNDTPGAHAYMERMAAYKRSAIAQETKDQVEATQFKQAQTTQDGVLTIANSAIDAGETPETLVKNVNTFFQTNKAVNRLPFKEQTKMALDALDPLLSRMDREPDKRDAILASVKAIAELPRKGEDGVERRLIDSPDGIGEMFQKKVTEFTKKRDGINDKALVAETSDIRYKASERPQDVSEEYILTYAKQHPGAFKTGEVESLLVNRRKALDAAAKEGNAYAAERQVKDGLDTLNAQNYQRAKDGDATILKDVKMPTKRALLSNGQVDETSTVTADQQWQAVVDARDRDMAFAKNEAVNQKKMTPEQADRWQEKQDLDFYSLNGRVPEGWKEQAERGMNQITAAISQGKAPPAEALKAFERFKLVRSSAPNLLREVTDNDTKQFYEVADAYNGAPMDQLRAAANYYAKRDEEKEKVKKVEINKAVDAMMPNAFSRFIQRGFGQDVPENLGIMNDKIMKRAAILATAYGFTPEKAVEHAAKAVRGTYAIVNGWAVDTNDKRLPPNFEKLAEKHLDSIVSLLGPQALGVKSAKDLTLTSQPDGSFMVVNKRFGYPVEGNPIITGPDGQNYDATFLTPDMVQMLAREQRKEVEQAAVREGKERLQPLFVIPGTSIGMGRPNLQGYSKEEAEQVTKNIDAAAKPKGNNKAAVEVIGQNAEAARAAEDEAYKKREWMKPFPLKETILLKDSKR